jgi:hypothetical protein
MALSEASRRKQIPSSQLANSANPLALPFIVIDSPKTISTASRTSDVVTINLSAAHGIASLDLPAYVTLGTPSVATQPITGIDAGSYLMSYVDADSLSFANVGVDDPTLVVNGTYGKIATIIDDNAVSAIYGSCLFRTPFSPPSGPAQWLFQRPPAESKFLAASQPIPAIPGLARLPEIYRSPRFSPCALFRMAVYSLRPIHKLMAATNPVTKMSPPIG